MALSDAAAYAVAAWDLDEASGTRVDQVGSLDLTDNNTVGSAAGMFGNSGDFEKDNSEYLSRAGNDDTLDVGDTLYMVRFWVKLESKTTSFTLVSHWNSDEGDAGRSYGIDYDQTSDRFLATWNTVEGVKYLQANNLGSPSTGTWYLIHAWHDPTANSVNISVNAGTADSTSYSPSGGINGATSARFTVGAVLGSGPAYVGFADALIDDVVILKNYALDATERTEDYNGGTGVAFADWAGAAVTKIFLPSLLAVA